jgi:predicted permease
VRRFLVLRHRLRSLFRREAVEGELERELRLHLEQLTREHMESGLSEPEARRAARLEFGSADLAGEQCRDARRVGLLEDFVKDLGYAWRLLRRSPGFALTAVLSLALGVGANTAIFSLVDAVLLRLLPVERPQELVFLHSAGTEGTSGAPPYPCFERWRSETTAFAGMAIFATDEGRLEVDGRLEQVFGQVVSGSYFDVLGLRPAAGRLLRPDDERLDPPVAVISHRYWQRRFSGEPAAIGRTVVSSGRVYTIVGVTPPGFWGLVPGRQVELTLPFALESRMRANADTRWFDAVARLRAGARVAEATAQADAVYQSFMKDRPGSDEVRKKYFDRIELHPAGQGLEGLRRRFSRPLLALMLVSGIVLLIACANLANVLLARGAARARELAIRLATGAGFSRLLRQLLTETLVLFAIGAAAGLWPALFASRALAEFFAIGRNPILLDVRFDFRLAAYAMLLALVAGLLTGLWPALRALKSEPRAAMQAGEGRLLGSRQPGKLGRALVVAQVALSLVLLVAAAMFVRTIANLRAAELGFSGERVLTMSLDPILRGDAADVRREQFWMRVLERVRALPGVRAASLSVLTPLSGRDRNIFVGVPGFEPTSHADRTVRLNLVSEDYFRTLGIEVVAGRAFDARDSGTSPKVAMLNEAAARSWFAGRDPLGATLSFGKSGDHHQVVGVVRDHKHKSVQEAPPRFAYVPLWQRVDPVTRTTLALLSDEPQAALARAVVDEVRAVHPETLVSDVIGVEEQIAATLVGERLLSTLASAFAALALLLAAVVVYGVLSYSVARRRAELGLRMALGAAPARVASDVLRDVLLQVAAGMAIGLPAAAMTARAAEGLLFGVAPADPGSYLLSAAVLALAAGAAAWLPARRACSIDPSEALRAG